MFAFEFEERLFAFRQPKPAFVPLFALAARRAPLIATTFVIYNFFNVLFALLRAPSFAFRQKRHKRNTMYAYEYEERPNAPREPKPAYAPVCAPAARRAPNQPLPGVAAA